MINVATPRSDASNKNLTLQYSGFENKRVLIIEDMNEMRMMLKSIMVDLGYTRIDVEASGQSAVKRVLNHRYDIILSDQNLGGSINGQQILEIIRKNNELDHSTIFIMITADTTYESVVSILEHQPDSYIVKPFPPVALHRRFSRVMKQKEVFETINSARMGEDYKTMEDQARHILRKYPHHASLCLKVIGESLYGRRQYTAAKTHYKSITQSNQTFAWAYFGIAQCEMKLGNITAAIESLKKTIGISPHYLSAYDLLADAEETLGHYKEAQSAIKTALESSPRSIERSQRLGEISYELEDWIIAEQAFSRVIRLVKDSRYETPSIYYYHLKTINSMVANGLDNSKLSDRFERSLSRLRFICKADPTIVSNSFRIEVERLVARNRTNEAIQSWKRWNYLIEKGRATPLTQAQEYTLKKLLSIL